MFSPSKKNKNIGVALIPYWPAKALSIPQISIFASLQMPHPTHFAQHLSLPQATPPAARSSCMAQFTSVRNPTAAWYVSRKGLSDTGLVMACTGAASAWVAGSAAWA